jgi:hypothetical protein
MSESAELEPWQQRALETVYKYKGRGFVQITGRNAGKSQLNAYKRLFDDVMSRPVEALVCEVGKVFGARYHTVQPIGGNWLEMESWCIKTFGPAGSIWDQTKNFDGECHRWYMNDRRFWFRHQKDRDWFVIRWNA